MAPEGAKLADGGTLHWEGVTNLTILLNLPNIRDPDRIVYVVESVMTNDGTVLQVAAGIYPNDTNWFAYSWSISNVDSIPPTYRWILNASSPMMVPASLVSISIFQTSGLWNLRVEDVETGVSVERPYTQGIAPVLMAGDQEVFALESYSRTAATFRSMGNLTVQSLMVNGQRVTGGLYAYGDWDGIHNPVFVVGSSGTGPPNFISIEGRSDGTIVWRYEAVWGNSGNSFVGIDISIAVLSVVSFAVLGAVVLLTRKSTPRE